MFSIGHLITWIIMGGLVGYVVSLLMGERFKGGPLAYVVVGIVVLVGLGLVLTLLKVAAGIFVVAALIIVGAAIVRGLGAR
jgi:uncharacterized membrane protein YeaQ/YmgE (transglycosylase-associated protein family)